MDYYLIVMSSLKAGMTILNFPTIIEFVLARCDSWNLFIFIYYSMEAIKIRL
jgi:hypothetical protein